MLIAIHYFQEFFFPFMYVGILIMIRALVKPETEPALTFPVNDLKSASTDVKGRHVLVVNNGLNVGPVIDRVRATMGFSYKVKLYIKVANL